MGGLSKAETILEKFENTDESNRKAGTGRVPKEILIDPKQLKEFQRQRAIEAYLKLVVLSSNVKFQRQHMREYMDLCRYLYEVSFGKPAYNVNADLGESLPLHVTFQLAPKPELNGKTANTRQITQGNTESAKERS